ncbi:unnamed protein product [Symbiodinium sp. KB8]|nr:unnamed protein product [Symbiodinium sp. KB8]
MAWWRFLLLLSSSLAFRKSDFTDWDCRRVNSKLVLWNTLREVAVAEADAAESSLFTVPNLVSTVSDFETSTEVFEMLFTECPLGTIFLLEIALGSCLLNHGQYTFEPCEATGDLLMEFMLRRNVSMAMLLTATWPIKQALDMPFLYEFGADTASSWHTVQNSPVYICDQQVADNGEGGFEWPQLQELIWIAVRDEEQVLPKVRNLIFGKEIQNLVTDQLQDPHHFLPDCLSGWIATLLIFAGITWHMESYVYFSYEQVLKRYLAALEFWEFFGSGWLLSALMGQVCVMHRTINEMDFSGSELLKDPHINSIGSLRLKASPIFSATAAAVLGEGARPYSVNGESRLLTYAVYVWGEAFLKWLPAYIRRFHSLGVYNLMVFGDIATYQVCSAIQRAVCLQLDTKNSLHRYTIPLALMNLGVDAFILDFDIYPFQDPTPVLISEMESYSVAPELLIGGSFGDACICNALAFYRSTPSLRDFIRGLLDWLYEHPFPHAVSQRALSAFLGEAPMQKKQSTSPVVVKAERLAPWLPDRASPGIAWAVLDPGVQFSSSANLETSGWAGDAEDIVIYHFFYGAWLEAEVAMQIEVKEWVAEQGQGMLVNVTQIRTEVQAQELERTSSNELRESRNRMKTFRPQACQSSDLYSDPVGSTRTHVLDAQCHPFQCKGTVHINEPRFAPPAATAALAAEHGAPSLGNQDVKPKAKEAEVYMPVATHEGLRDPGKFLTLDTKLLETEASKSRAVRGRQVLYLFDQYFKTNEEVGELYYLHVENWDYAARGKKKDNRSWLRDPEGFEKMMAAKRSWDDWQAWEAEKETQDAKEAQEAKEAKAAKKEAKKEKKKDKKDGKKKTREGSEGSEEMPSKLKKKPEPAPSVPKPLLPKPLNKRLEGQIPAAFRARPMQLSTYQLVQPPAININIFAGSSAAGSSDAIAGLMPLLSSLMGGGGPGAPAGSGVGPIITEMPHDLEDGPEEEQKKDDMEEDGKGDGEGDKNRKRDDMEE